MAATLAHEQEDRAKPCWVVNLRKSRATDLLLCCGELKKKAVWKGDDLSLNTRS